MEYTVEMLGENIPVCISKNHRFGTDAFLLCDFSNYKKNDIVCDFGTGCGIIPLLMTRSLPPKKIYAVDIQREAIDLLEESLRLGGADMIEPVCADLCRWRGTAPGSVSLVTCNPPYKAAGSGIESAGDSQRIARHEIMCDIGEICLAAARLLKFGGRLCICSRPERLADCMKAMQQSGIEPKRLRTVSKTPADAPWLFLLEGMKGGKPFMKILPQLYTWEGDDFSQELREIYAGRKAL